MYVTSVPTVGSAGEPLTITDRAGICLMVTLAVSVLEEIGEPLSAVAFAELVITPPAL